jgi:transcriptional regulator with GAF, ATPase, and Fis domain
MRTRGVPPGGSTSGVRPRLSDRIDGRSLDSPPPLLAGDCWWRSAGSFLIYKRWVAPSLVVIGGPLTGARFPLTEPNTAVGRDPGNVVVLNDSSVSPHHCVLRWDGRDLTIRDLDRMNPCFVNGLPATTQPLADGDQIQVGGSILLLSTKDPCDVSAGALVRIEEGPELAGSTIVLRREDVLVGTSGQIASAARLSRDLAALIRISAAVNGVRGLVALERPLIALIADVVPADRGALVLRGQQGTDIDSAVGWSRARAGAHGMPVSRPILERVLHDIVGVLSNGPSRESSGAGAPGVNRSMLAAPLFAFDKAIGAIVLESDGNRFDEGHLRLLLAVGGVAGTALEQARHIESLESENRRLQAELHLDYNMMGESAPMQELYRRIARVAPTESTVLITGESGTGKELVARAIHRHSTRARGPFVAINSAAITETLLESELFGHERGAFTGAVAQKKGKLESADGGTVFLDEVGELSLALQAKLLRALQEREFERVGGTKGIRVDFRLIAATNRDLEAAIADGAFRRDLYYRLNVVSLATPQLRDRRDDIPLLAAAFARRHAAKTRRVVSGFSPEALACLMAHDWPGNVRELDNAVEHAVVLGSTAQILPEDLPDVVAEASAAGPSSGVTTTGLFHDAVKLAKRDLIMRAVERAGGNYTAAARLLGLHPNYLHRLINNLQLKAALKHAHDR